jgi:hypothetical protein
MDKKDQAAVDLNCTDAQLDQRRLLLELSALMSKLKTIRGKAKLREYMNWQGVKANETRWNGNFRMCSRFLQFKDDLGKIATEETPIGQDVANLLPCPVDILKIITLEKQLTKLHLVSLFLQKRDGDVNLADVRGFFDRLINDFGQDFKDFLASDAAIFNNEHLKNGIVAVLSKGSAFLTEEQQEALERCEIGVVNMVDENDDFAGPSDYAAGF